MRLVSYCVHVAATVGRPRGRPPNLNDSVYYVGIDCFPPEFRFLSRVPNHI